MPLDEAVFLDRDGTLIEEVNYLSRAEQVRLIPGAADAVRRVNEAGARVVVVTNQAGVARGFFPEGRVAEVHAHLEAMLSEHGAKVDAFYYCPHHATEGVGALRVDCDCRKPKPGMLLPLSLTAASRFIMLSSRSPNCPTKPMITPKISPFHHKC